jgi:uncharacterized membrane protein YhaH (DUF805 family)
MNDFLARYKGLEGRLSRKDWWFGAIALLVVGIVLDLILMLIGMGPTSAAGHWAGLIVFIILAYPGYALSIKRRHDRASNGLDLQIYYVLVFLLMLVEALGIGMAPVPLPDGSSVLAPSPLLGAIGGLIGIYGIYLLVVLGFLKGSEGANTFGADPLAAAA